MTKQGACDPGKVEEARLPRRDWILLPMLGLLTICAIAVCAELIARRMFSESKTGVAACLVLNDPSTGVRGTPNSVCREKLPESSWVEYRFNRCGHRAGMECGPKPPGTYRIVMFGSSLAMGARVQREESFAALLPAEISRLTGHTTELYNEGMVWSAPHGVAQRFNDVLAAKPNMILWAVGPWDIENETMVVPTAEDVGPPTSLSVPERLWMRVQAIFAKRSFAVAIVEVGSHTRTALMVRHYLYLNESPGWYLKSYLKLGDTRAGFLRTEPSAEWRKRLREFDNDAADIEARAKAAGVPFVVVLIPNRAQAAMTSMVDWPDGYDPYKLDDELRPIIVSHGGTYINILLDFRNIPNPERGYMPVDGHLYPAGHAMISGLLAKELTSGIVPALRAAAQPQVAVGGDR